jgi:hypothetical protein
MTTLHKIRAYLYSNALTKDTSNDFIAGVNAERSRNVNDTFVRVSPGCAPVRKEHGDGVP